MFFHFPYGYPLPSGLTSQSEGPDNELYHNWLDAIAKYRSKLGGSNQPTSRFWLVIRVQQENYSEKIEYHGDFPMLVPVEGEGELWGIASSSEELNRMITPDPELPYDKRKGHVYLVYKIRVEGSKDWRALLNFLAKHGMLERENA